MNASVVSGELKKRNIEYTSSQVAEEWVKLNTKISIMRWFIYFVNLGVVSVMFASCIKSVIVSTCPWTQMKKRGTVPVFLMLRLTGGATRITSPSAKRRILSLSCISPSPPRHKYTSSWVLCEWKNGQDCPGGIEFRDISQQVAFAAFCKKILPFGAFPISHTFPILSCVYSVVSQTVLMLIEEMMWRVCDVSPENWTAICIQIVWHFPTNSLTYFTNGLFPQFLCIGTIVTSRLVACFRFCP